MCIRRKMYLNKDVKKKLDNTCCSASMLVVGDNDKGSK